WVLSPGRASLWVSLCRCAGDRGCTEGNGCLAIRRKIERTVAPCNDSHGYPPPPKPGVTWLSLAPVSEGGALAVRVASSPTVVSSHPPTARLEPGALRSAGGGCTSLCCSEVAGRPGCGAAGGRVSPTPRGVGCGGV